MKRAKRIRRYHVRFFWAPLEGEWTRESYMVRGYHGINIEPPTTPGKISHVTISKRVRAEKRVYRVCALSWLAIGALHMLPLLNGHPFVL